MSRDPKPFADFLQTNVLAGFLVWYGYYIQSRDLWTIHEWIGPPIMLVGVILYVWNWWWGWKIIQTTSTYSGIRWKFKRGNLAIAYGMFGLTCADAFIHWHHDAAPTAQGGPQGASQ